MTVTCHRTVKWSIPRNTTISNCLWCGCEKNNRNCSYWFSSFSDTYTLKGQYYNWTTHNKTIYRFLSISDIISKPLLIVHVLKWLKSQSYNFGHSTTLKYISSGYEFHPPCLFVFFSTVLLHLVLGFSFLFFPSGLLPCYNHCNLASGCDQSFFINSTLLPHYSQLLL